MTSKEVANRLGYARSVLINKREMHIGSDIDNAFYIAIKILEQQSCDDAISRAEAIRVASGYCHWTNIPAELAKLPSVSTEKVGTDHWEKLWDKLYDWLNDTRMSVAPDETVKDDIERNERLAQADMLDEVMECMLDMESDAKMQEETETCKDCTNKCIMYDPNMKGCKDKTEGVEE